MPRADTKNLVGVSARALERPGPQARATPESITLKVSGESVEQKIQINKLIENWGFN